MRVSFFVLSRSWLYPSFFLSLSLSLSFFCWRQGLRGVKEHQLDKCWIANRLKDEHHEQLRSTLDEVSAQLSGQGRLGSIYDTSQRM